jgi:hypothetical protein
MICSAHPIKGSVDKSIDPLYRFHAQPRESMEGADCFSQELPARIAFAAV